MSRNPNRGRVHRRCACRDNTGNQLGARCPDLANRAVTGSGRISALEWELCAAATGAPLTTTALGWRHVNLGSHMHDIRRTT